MSTTQGVWKQPLLIMVLIVLLCGNYALAEEKPSFNRKVISIIVCTKVGGGFDNDARLVAPFLQKELPGSTVIVRNVPGGGHIVGANRVWDAKPNGLTLGVGNVTGLIQAQIRGEKGINFDLRKFTWIGRLYSRHRFLIARKNAGFDTVDALMTSQKEFKIGAAGVGDGPYSTGLLTADALGLKNMRIIPNYGGSDEMTGLLRKEIEGVIGGLESWNELIDQGAAIPLLTYDMKRNPAQPQVPALSELVKTPMGKAIAVYSAGEAELSRSVFAPPNMPENITKTIRTALLKALQNQEFKKIIAKLKREPFDPLPGDELAKKMKMAFDLPPDLTKRIRALGKEE